MNCGKLYTEPYRFENHPMCNDCAYRHGVAQQLEKERSAEREADAVQRAEEERLAAEKRAKEEQEREQLRRKIEAEAAWKAERESLVKSIERYIDRAEWELVEMELAALGSQLKSRGSAEPDPDYIRLQAALEEGRCKSNPHICPVTGMEFVIVPAGSYQMGDVWGDMYDGCKPVHTVEIPEFQLGKYPVTQAQWLAVMGGENPAASSGEKFVHPDKPVINVSWDDAQEFVDRLNRKTENRFGYRLPSEAEWEYAARSGGSRDKWSGTSNESGVSGYAHCDQGLDSSTIKVGGKRPNDLGLYDMSGNVWEWCQDVWYDNYNGAPSDGSAWMSEGGAARVYRGGSWGDSAADCRSAGRGRCGRGFCSGSLGFRLLQDSK
jgi:formylglycine-generating enzyme required for sulfatase activity